MGVDLLIHDALVLIVDERNRLYKRGTVLVTDGCIEDVRTSRGGDSEIDASTIIDGNGKLVMPGLVNAHTHLEMTPLIGAFSELNLTEMLGSGTALFNRLGNGDFTGIPTAPHRWVGMFTLCSRPKRQLLAVPTSRYSYPGMGFRDTSWPQPSV
jgi:hypothetical protein